MYVNINKLINNIYFRLKDKLKKTVPKNQLEKPKKNY